MDFQHRVQRSFKPRFAVIYPFALFFVLFGTIDNGSLKAGIGYVIAGFLIRLWSNGYAIKNDKLTTSGPYAFVRNPLYLGTFLIVLGFMLILKMDIYGGNIVKILFLIGLAITYSKTIKSEQGMLLAKFGKAYEQYCAKIPAMIPCLTPYTEGEQWSFSLDRLIYSKEYKTIFWITVILIVFHLKTRLLIEHKPMTPKTWGLIFLGVLLIAIDIIYEINKKKK